MIQLYPDRAIESLEFDKVKALLHKKCRMDAAHERVDALRFHTKLEYVQKELQQTHEYKMLLGGGEHFPNDFTTNMQKELQLLSIARSVLTGAQLLSFEKLAHNIRDIKIWFSKHEGLYEELRAISEHIKYDKHIPELITSVIDDTGTVRDNASRELMNIRSELSSLRQQQRKAFEGILRKLNKQGYLADISESFLNGRRTVAVFAEHKRIVKGILHGASDSQRTVFIEPEATIELNNDIFSMERAEAKEIQRILADTTAALAVHHPQLETYYHICGLYDFIRAKAQFAQDINGNMPRLSPHPGLDLVKAAHPLLLLHNQKQNKPTIPLNIKLDRHQRILIISGPNAGGKTVTMKTAGLIQLMAQSGLLAPVDSTSEIGIFKQVMIHIGDTQSIEHELSTYSAHLRDMKHFMDFANGKTLFFIDELGSGSDPNLGGSFAEAIVEELASKHALGIITTHYLNLKVMAGKVPGIVNGAMAFDEEKLEPLYKLSVGKPGSSYTFAIAQRSELSPKIIQRARELTERGHFKLDKMLLKTEQQAVRLGQKEKELDKKIKETEQAKKRYEQQADKEQQKHHLQTLKLQNEIKKEELEYLRDMERKFKQIIQDWKKAENKNEVIDAAEKVLFKKKQIKANAAQAKKADKNYKTVGGVPKPGDFMRHKVNHQVGILQEINDKKAIIKIGKMPFTVKLDEWVVVSKKAGKNKKQAR